MAEEQNEFLGFFLDEALDVLSVWEKSCLELEKSGSSEAKEELYRSAHNLKSGSGAVGLSSMNELVHKVEDLIAKILAGHLQKTPAIIKVFLTTHSLLLIWIERLKAGLAFDGDLEVKEIYHELLRIQSSEASSADPTSSPLASTDFAAGSSPADLLLQSIGSPRTPADQKIELKSEQDLSFLHAQAEAKVSTPSAKSQESIRVAASKLDQLIQLIGELSTQQAIVWHGRQNGQVQSPGCDNAIQLIQKIAKDLQGLALSLRLQPLQSLFQRLERTACDLARTQEKKIEVVIRGEHVEVDRSVIERISDAMNHVIRNAVDHGIETPSERQHSKKRETPTLSIEAVQETNGVLISISDDGRGLNSERIQEKAIERGIIRPDAKLSQAEINRLIFHAGLSTAEKLTDISGRGVGMDVVKNSVETIGGTIQVSSQAQVGTSFAISLPATLSIIDSLIIGVEGNRYAVPVQDVAEIVNIENSRIEAVAGLGTILSLRKQLIPIEPLRAHLPPKIAAASHRSIDLRASVAGGSIQPALIVRKGETTLGFEVDVILGQQPVTVRRLPHTLSQIPGYTGGTILGDGDPCIILNLSALLSRHFEKISKSPDESRSNSQDSSSEIAEEEQPRSEHHCLIFEVYGQELAAPLLSIKEVMKDLPCSPMVGAARHLLGSIEVRGELLPVYDLSTLLGLPAHPEYDHATDLVLEEESAAFAIRVSKVLAVSDLKTLRSPIPGKQATIIPGMRGYLGTGYYEGRPVPLLDLQKCLRLWKDEAVLQSNLPLEPASLLETP